MNNEITKRILKEVDYDKYHPKVKKDIRKAISLTIAEKDIEIERAEKIMLELDKELNELKQLYKVRNDDAKDYAKTITKKDAQKDLFIKKLKELTKDYCDIIGLTTSNWFKIIDKLNKEVFEDES